MTFPLAVTFTFSTRNRSGGKPAAASLLKPIKSKTKRAAFLAWHLIEPQPISATMTRLGMSRANVFSHWAAIHREHGIGYVLENDRINVQLPPGTKDIFK